MLNEVISFVDVYDRNTSKQHNSDWIDKKFFIIKTKTDDDDILSYDGFEILDEDPKIKEWIKKNKHYEKVLNNLGHYVSPGDNNKALGSTSGLLTYSFFVFKLFKTILNKLEKKIDKTKFTNDDHKIIIENIHKIMKDAISDLTEKDDVIFKYENYYALIHTDKEKLEKWNKVALEFIETRMSYGIKNLITSGKCYTCEIDGEVSPPIFLTTYNEDKIFLKHITRPSEDNKGIPLRMCKDCVKKLNKFENILKNYNIKIFPLFIKSDCNSEGILLLSNNLKKNENKFEDIFSQLTKKQNNNIFDFYLVVKSGDYFFFDYVTGYGWEIGEYKDFFKKNLSYPITRSKFEKKLANTLTGKSYINYFDKIKGEDSQQTNMIYSFRQKIFDFVYRNQSSLSMRDLQDIVLFRIEKSIKDKSKPSEESFNLLFNGSILLSSENKTNCILDDVEDIKKKILSDGKLEISSDEVWAYFAGQIAFYLVSLSKSKDKTFGLLEPFTNKSTINLVKKTIEHLIEQYKHEIHLNNKRFKKIMTCIFSYQTDRSFIELKIPFYVGACDDNVIYYKKEESVNDK